MPPIRVPDAFEMLFKDMGDFYVNIFPIQNTGVWVVFPYARTRNIIMYWGFT